MAATNTAVGRDVPVQSRTSRGFRAGPGTRLRCLQDFPPQDPTAALSFPDATSGTLGLGGICGDCLTSRSPQHGFNNLHQVHRWVPAVRGAGEVSLRLCIHILCCSHFLPLFGSTERPPPTWPHLEGCSRRCVQSQPYFRACTCNLAVTQQPQRYCSFLCVILLKLSQSKLQEVGFVWVRGVTGKQRRVSVHSPAPLCQELHVFMRHVITHAPEPALALGSCGWASRPDPGSDWGHVGTSLWFIQMIASLCLQHCDIFGYSEPHKDFSYRGPSLMNHCMQSYVSYVKWRLCHSYNSHFLERRLV